MWRGAGWGDDGMKRDCEHVLCVCVWCESVVFVRAVLHAFVGGRCERVNHR